MGTEPSFVDWNSAFEALVAITILAFFVERALSLLFEWRHFAARFGSTGVKEPIAFAVALVVTWQWDFDALSMVVVQQQATFLGEVITAAVIAGGSKASIKLFQDLAGVRNRTVQKTGGNAQITRPENEATEKGSIPEEVQP